MLIRHLMDRLSKDQAPETLSQDQIATLWLWMMHGNDVSEDVKQLIEQARQSAKERFGEDWYNTYQAERTYCDRCGERYRRENLMTCYGCFDEFCYRCEGQHKRNCSRMLQNSHKAT